MKINKQALTKQLKKRLQQIPHAEIDLNQLPAADRPAVQKLITENLQQINDYIECCGHGGGVMEFEGGVYLLAMTRVGAREAGFKPKSVIKYYICALPAGHPLLETLGVPV